MKIGNKEIDLGTMIAVLTAIIGATIYLTTIRVQLSDAKERISSLERGISLTNEKNKAIADIKAESAELTNYRLPVGTIVAFYGSSETIPKGFLLCNGQGIAKTNYPELYAQLEMSNTKLIESEEIARLPDLQGMFLRGLNESDGVDAKRILGSVQNSQMQSHTHKDNGHGHKYNVTGQDSMFGSDSPPHGPGKNETKSVQNSKANIGDPVKSTQGNVAHGSENRPINVAVSFLIKT